MVVNITDTEIINFNYIATIRKMVRKNLPKKYKCCGYPMTYKESYGEYVCEECGRIRRPVKEK